MDQVIWLLPARNSEKGNPLPITRRAESEAGAAGLRSSSPAPSDKATPAPPNATMRGDRGSLRNWKLAAPYCLSVSRAKAGSADKAAPKAKAGNFIGVIN